jgi:hypothetical protein
MRQDILWAGVATCCFSNMQRATWNLQLLSPYRQSALAVFDETEPRGPNALVTARAETIHSLLALLLTATLGLLLAFRHGEPPYQETVERSICDARRTPDAYLCPK